jgi:hypothetical protein
MSATSSGLAAVELGGAPEPLVTPIFAKTVVPCGIVAGSELAVVLEVQEPEVVVRQSVDVVVIKLPTPVFLLGHIVTKFVTLIEPSPVARSKPLPAVYEGVPAGVPVSTTPSPVAPELLQLNEPAAQGTELLPFVTSLNMQAEFGIVDELQL